MRDGVVEMPQREGLFRPRDDLQSFDWFVRSARAGTTEALSEADTILLSVDVTQTIVHEAHDQNTLVLDANALTGQDV